MYMRSDNGSGQLLEAAEFCVIYITFLSNTVKECRVIDTLGMPSDAGAGGTNSPEINVSQAVNPDTFYYQVHDVCCAGHIRFCKCGKWLSAGIENLSWQMTEYVVIFGCFICISIVFFLNIQCLKSRPSSFYNKLLVFIATLISSSQTIDHQFQALQL